MHVSRQLHGHLATSDAPLPSIPVSMQHGGSTHACSSGGTTASRCSGAMRTGRCGVGPAHLQAARAGVAEHVARLPWDAGHCCGVPAKQAVHQQRDLHPQLAGGHQHNTLRPLQVTAWKADSGAITLKDAQCFESVQLPRGRHTGLPATAAGYDGLITIILEAREHFM